jgi:hypothetical protein
MRTTFTPNGAKRMAALSRKLCLWVWRPSTATTSADFRGSSRTHFIATTKELLTTAWMCPGAEYCLFPLRALAHRVLSDGGTRHALAGPLVFMS